MGHEGRRCDGPDGYITADVVDAIQYAVGPIPVAFIVLVATALFAEFVLRRRRWGWRLRATGSDEEAARRVGVTINRTVILGYVLTSLFTALGAVMLMGQIGVGDPRKASATRCRASRPSCSVARACWAVAAPSSARSSAPC